MKGILCWLFLVVNWVNAIAQESFEDSVALYFNEVKVATQLNRSLWSYDLIAPIMLVNRNTRAIYASVADSMDVLTKEEEIYIGTLPKEVNIANTSIRWAGQHWAMIMLPLPKDKNDRVNLITHELFHRAQSYLKLNPRNYDNNHLDKKEGRIYLRLELEALRKAMSSTSTSEINKHLSSALAFRKYRHEIFPGSDSTENLLELNEGLCEFTGAMMSARNKRQMQEHFSKRIDAFLINQTFIRSFPYETIPIYGFLLSQRNRDWNKEITIRTDLTDYFSNAFRLKFSNDLKREVSRIQNSYSGEAIHLAETARENKIKALLDEYRTKFIKNPHLEIAFENMSVSFNYTDISTLDDQGVVYPSIRAKDNWGVLDVTNGALMSPDWKKITLSNPTSVDGRVVTGDGWILELNEGYTILKDIFTNKSYLSKKW